MPAIGSDGIKIDAQIFRFDTFLHAGAFLLDPEKIRALNERRRGFPRRLDR
jgi:hypothetical protein